MAATVDDGVVKDVEPVRDGIVGRDMGPILDDGVSDILRVEGKDGNSIGSFFNVCKQGTNEGAGNNLFLGLYFGGDVETSFQLDNRGFKEVTGGGLGTAGGFPECLSGGDGDLHGQEGMCNFVSVGSVRTDQYTFYGCRL